LTPVRDRRRRESTSSRIRRAVVGAGRDLGDPSLFHRIALVPLFAWIGLGADGISSSPYGMLTRVKCRQIDDRDRISAQEGRWT